MYRLGRPTTAKRPKKFYFLELAAIIIVVVGALFSVFWFVIKKEKPADISSNGTPLISRVQAADKFTEINEPTFTLKLPGEWKEADRDSDPGRKSIKWDYIGKGGIGRWVKVYIDTIPTDYSVTYVLPVSSDGDKIFTDSISDHCSQFTPGAMKPSDRGGYAPASADKLPTQWQGVKFVCDGAHPLYQRVGTSSKEEVNSVSVTGPTKGTHKYFFIYDDSYYNPDYTIFSIIIDSFRAK